MMAIFNLLMMCCFIQDGGFVVTDGPTVSAFVVTDRAPVTPKLSEKKPAVVEDAAVNVKPRYFFRVFTADWCGGCREFKNAGRIKELQQTAEVEVIDIDKDKTYSDVPSIPRVRIYDRETGKWINEWIGNQSTSAMRNEYSKKLTSVAKPASREPSLYGRAGTSHESRETLIHHLLADGIHQGRHSRLDLERMSDRELVDLHDNEHEEHGDVVKNGLWRQK